MSSTAIEFGLINTLRTNHLIVDALLCMVVPVLIQRVMAAMQNSQSSLWTLLCSYLFPPKTDQYVTREIESSQKFNRYGVVWDNEQKNKILQKALAMYLAEIIDMRNKNARCELIEKPKKKKTAAVKQLVDDVSDNVSESSATTTASSVDTEVEVEPLTQAERLNIEALPPLGDWIEVGDGVEFRHEDISPENGGGDDKTTSSVKECKTKYVLRSACKDGSKRIDTLVKKAFEQYRERERAKHKTDKSRYFYIQAGTKASQSDSDQQVVAYKRYALGEEKTFENLFFDDKPQVLSLLDDFMGKTGKFAIRGFPYKLGFMLHGPPGTGKTSLIKAIAQHTKRHIVTINLSKIKTNQELMDAVFDLKFAVQDQDLPVSLTFKDVVFVMEDIDAASKIVSSREKADHTCSDKSSSMPGLTRAEKMADSQKKAAQTDDADDALMETMIGPAMKPKDDGDRLNLSGLLNVLDGVIDCPGRIVIMTTNHPEKLDAALVRPGRVNKMLLLSHMNAVGAQEMIEYYCLCQLTEAQQTRLVAVFDANAAAKKPFTPAEVEEFCAEMDDADSVIDALEQHASEHVSAF